MRIASVRFVHPVLFRGHERTAVAPGSGNYLECWGEVVTECLAVVLHDTRDKSALYIPLFNVRSYVLQSSETGVQETPKRGPGRPRTSQAE